MKYLRLTSTDPHLNLAIEEHLFRTADDDVFMLWQNRSAVVIGKNQNAYAEVDLGYAEAHGIALARRLTGGGAVYHDLGNLNYTVIARGGGAALDYARFTEPIVLALASLGVRAELSGRNDLECEGRKISGSAQAVARGRVLHHGTLLYDTDVDVMSAVLRAGREKLSHRAVGSHAGRVMNLKERLTDCHSVTELCDRIEAFALSRLGATRGEAPSVDEVGELYKRNGSREWLLSERRFLTEYSVSRRRAYPFGVVQAEMTLLGDVIEGIALSGDFFGARPVEELEAALVGRPCEAVLSLPVSRYIDGMAREELYALLTDC
ncbi:MAG: lipoate--protein ligase [Clostridia bacterium]|nr:lipoate--protein ligase [Clostridia bacterium]